ncbi:heat-inducible transcriptional repressor HrcA [Schaalia sp. 19OD2882]|uniref:heat-inducible transcriptional repressor HrcA n=1 Tax=Schaalia sp. 19OD2882 TaxID=2794089 RepID=UPI001C1EB678|nr:heat-inducible transcriptional repressor HrcA [Schaalia sp. 19OD2882]QWW19038.1 heat-inducible transcriptional repressor HrcA [Schaalia sp. 19OD2882]
MSEDRRLDVLRAIVSEYVHTREPVGSKVIAAGHDLGVSSATIRNDMALLEEAGLIYQPHTSAGRVPTDRGYRLFVDHLTTLKPMSAPERRAVEAFLARGVDLDDVVTGTVRLLAQVTRQVAVIEYPTLHSATLRRIELVDLTPRRLLVVVITSAGSVEERIVDLDLPVDTEDVERLRVRVNEECEGLDSQAAAERLNALVDEADPATDAALACMTQAVAQITEDLLRPSSESRMVVAGLSNIARSNVDFRDITPVLDALEEKVALLRLFQELALDDSIHVSIGSENQHDGLAQTSVVASTYGAADGSRAHLGIVGPTRMDYARAMSSVRAVAAYLSRYLNH